MKRLFSLYILLSLVLTLPAKCVVFSLSNGNQAYYQIGGDRNPVLRWGDDGVTVMADSYTFGDILSFRLSNEDVPEDIKSLMADNTHHWQAGNLIVQTSDVYVTDLNGRPLPCHQTNSEGMTVIDLQSLATGTYLIHIGHSTLKVIK